MKNKSRTLVGVVALAILFGIQAQVICHAQDAVPLTSQEIPRTGGTFYVLQNTATAGRATAANRLLAPYPGLPPGGGIVYNVSQYHSGIYLVDQRIQPQIDADLLSALVTLRIQIAAAIARTTATTSGEMSLMGLEDGPPIPGEGGGGTNTDNGGSGFYAPTYSTNDVWMDVGWTNSGSSSLLNFTIHMPDTNSSWDLFGSTNLSNSGEGLNVTNWLWLGHTALGQTSISIPKPWPALGFFMLGNALIDSDFNGIPDAMEMLVHSNPDLLLTDGSGMSDGWEIEHFGHIGVDPNDDPDGDGYTNLDEFLLGQDPYAADPPRSTISITATDASAGEPNNTGTFRLTRDGTTTKALQVYFTVQGLARPSIDYQSLGSSATFAIGQSNLNLQVIPIDDNEYEGSEDVTLQLLPALEYITATVDSATVTISDDEVPPVKVSASYDPVVEGSGTNGVFSFYRDGDTRLPLTVNFTLTGTATNGVIYQTLPSSITFAADSSSTNLTVIAINNTNYSGTTTGIVTLLPNAAYRIETNAGTDELVFVDDDLPVASIVATDADAREAGLNPGRFTVSRTGATRDPLTVFYRVSGTAEMGCTTNYTGDYQSLSNVVVIPTGQSNAFIDIIPVQDTNAEPMELVILTLAGSENYRIGVSNSATVNIDDDEPLSYLVTVERPSIYSSPTSWQNRPGVIHITRTGSALAASSLSWSVTDTNGTPVYTGNYQWSGDFYNNNLYFAANRSTATVNLQHLSSAIPVLQFRFAGRIVTVPCWGPDRLVQIVPDTTHDFAIEGDPLTKARFYVQRAANGGAALAVKLSLGGAATRVVDFPMTNLAAVNFPQGSSSQTVEVYANSDALTEGWESLIVRLDTSDLSYAAYNANAAQTAFQETYAVLWLREASTTGPRPDVDSDDDLLTDAFEKACGLNPLVADDIQSDVDKDGLSVLEEQFAGTDPALADSDGDGVNDFFEISRGSNPTNAVDFALNADHTAKVICVVGDDSGSVSERWQLIVGCLTANNAVPGQVINRDINLKEGTNYTVRLRHLSSTESPPDLDYHIELRSSDSAPPAFLVRDPQQLLGSHWDPGDGPQYTNKTATVIVPKIELTWTNKGDNLVLDMNTNGFNGEVRGSRIFVGSKTPSENLPRNTVMLKIKTTPPLVGSNVWLRAFDVDDTTDDKGFDNAGVIDPNLRSGDDNFPDYLSTPKPGLFVTSGQSSNTVTLNASGEALVEFRVGMQPGNNYRIAATVFPTNNINTLQSSNAAGNGYVSAYTDKVRTGFNGVFSPMLTVWRKLNLEFDSMSAVQQSAKLGTVVNVSQNVPKNQSSVTMVVYPTAPEDSNLQNGTLTMGGISYHIVANHTRLSGRTLLATVIVKGLIPAAPSGSVCTFTDDDDYLLAEAGLPAPLPKLSALPTIVPKLQPLFAPSFVLVMDANAAGWNPRTTLPFSLNEPVTTLYWSSFENFRDTSDSHMFWSHLVSFGYQAETFHDGEPDNESALLGGTPKGVVLNARFSAIYVEAIRELWQSENWPKVLPGISQNLPAAREIYWNVIAGCIAHETGHSPGGYSEDADHAEQGLMATGNIKAYNQAPGHLQEIPDPFGPSTIRRFRNAQSWSP